jgi:hypothetical protein
MADQNPFLVLAPVHGIMPKSEDASTAPTKAEDPSPEEAKGNSTCSASSSSETPLTTSPAPTTPGLTLTEEERQLLQDLEGALPNEKIEEAMKWEGCSRIAAVLMCAMIAVREEKVRKAEIEEMVGE